MIETHNGDCVVVGIDGSTAAVYAAHWAVGEAIVRDVPLRLVSCVQGPQRSDRMTIEYARPVCAPRMRPSTTPPRRSRSRPPS